MTYVILITFSLLVLIPLVGVILASLNAPGGNVRAFNVPSTLHWANYVQAWSEAQFSVYMFNSLVVTLVATVVTAVISIMAGYAFGMMKFRGNNILFYTLLSAMIIPSQSIVVPMYFEFRSVGMTNTLWAIILPQIGQYVAFGTFWMRAYFRSAAVSLVEAARVDGASSRKILTSILIPLGRPAILTLSVLLVMWTWNAFLLPLVMISSVANRTAPLGLSTFQGEYLTDFPLLAAASVIIALPIIVFYIAFQRQFVRGMLTGAVVE